MIKLPIWLLFVMFLPVSLAAPEPEPRQTPREIRTIDPDYPSLSLTPLSPWA
ncbi:hypothetical protein N9Z83_00240 [Akkermansiaceae bacterium]|nr:hypothetical protein [Akkermansiaceae bacterium]